MVRPSILPDARAVTLVRACVLVLATLAPLRVAGAQGHSVTRSEVIAAALARAPRVALARADSAAAGAELIVARQYENPSLALQHTGSTPRQHVTLDLPTWVPAQRSLRIRSADAALLAATLRARFDIEGTRYDADTSYTHALVARERARLSTHSATDADSLVVLARIRRDAGDGSELDVQLAELSAGQFANSAALDSLGATSALYSVQSAMGLTSPAVVITLGDSLDLGSVDLEGATGTPLLIAAAESEVQASELALSLERGRFFTPPSLSVGFERQEPGGTGNQVLPTIGLSIPLPLLNRNRGGVLVAQAQLDRSSALLRVAQVETGAAVSLAEREQAIARERLARTQSLVSGAERVAALSLLAFREGAAALPSVLEAQRSSRDTRTQYVEAVGAARDAASRLRLLRLTTNRPGR
ncbi:MAG: TolC family protein [Gemmatimonadota bacterium]